MASTALALAIGVSGQPEHGHRYGDTSDSYRSDHAYVGGAGQQPRYGKRAGGSRKLKTFDRASTLIGALVRDRFDREIGEVTDVAFDLQSERVAYVMVDAGKVLGGGRNPIALPARTLRLDSKRQTVVTGGDRDRIARMRAFSSNNHPRIPNRARMVSGRGKGYAYGGSPTASDSRVLSGWIREVDPERGTLLVEGQNKTLRFRIAEDASVKLNGRAADVHDLRRGERVDVGYSYRNRANRAFSTSTAEAGGSLKATGIGAGQIDEAFANYNSGQR